MFAETGAGGEEEREIEEREKHLGKKLLQKRIFWKAFLEHKAERKVFFFLGSWCRIAGFFFICNGNGCGHDGNGRIVDALASAIARSLFN